MPTIREIINKLFDDDNKGALFEKICLYFLKHDKLQRAFYSDVQTWKDFSHSPDNGIDLIAKIRNSEKLCAVQCKFRANDESISKSEIDSFLAASSKEIFSERILFTLSDNFNHNAAETLRDQSPPVKKLTLADLENSSIDWEAFSFQDLNSVKYKVKEIRTHQRDAINDVLRGFSKNNRGRLIMACGTGKTFTSQKIAEKISGLVLVLVPSISLLNQSVLAWNEDADENINLISFAVCSDKTAGKKFYPDEDMKFSDLVISPTTDANELLKNFPAHKDKSMTVIFSTYQSLDVIHDAQQNGLPPFDLIICDEAHRTAGTSREEKISHFHRVHDDNFIRAHRRLYMSATPKIYADNAKSNAENKNVLLYSMDDEKIFGPEFHRLSFSEAVRRNLLADYKVMIFAINAHEVDELDKIQGVFKALKKEVMPEDYDFIHTDPKPMRRAVAFTNTIAQSEDFAENFSRVIQNPACKVQHIDGKKSSSERSRAIHWLEENSNENFCRILSNARCLSEGVDVPALDAVIFLNPRKSEIDIVQSVGRVMRKSPGKNFGYVILPVVVHPEETPEYALDHNESYKTVWKVLQGLRAHDDNFKVIINSLDLKERAEKIIIAREAQDFTSDDYFSDDKFERLRREINIRIVKKCGEREYWDEFVKDLVKATQIHTENIFSVIKNKPAKKIFDEFLESLRANINPTISEADAVNMLSQHIASRKVFDELFAGFSRLNPVSQSMQKTLDALQNFGLETSTDDLEKFYAYVHDNVQQADDDAAKQKLLRIIYERFFKFAFKETSENLGIVYTPEEIVDFILYSVDWAVKNHFQIHEGLSAQNINILDPFSGTGTFTARLIQLGIISPDALGYKYQNEIHANDILLLAYYISAVNIEAAFHQQNGGSYLQFPGMVLTDTFMLNSERTLPLDAIFFENGLRAFQQEKKHINVIIGNPPYNVGGKNNYAVDKNIAATYAKRGTAKHKGALYDSYIRAIRWASDRIETRGVICFVTNASFIDGNSADGMRKCLADEFSEIYIFNLRGNQRGGDWRKEGGKIFEEGSQLPIAITLFVKDAARKEKCRIFYHAVDDYQSRDEKLKALAMCESFGKMMGEKKLGEIFPNDAGDWVNQRTELYEGFLNLGNKNEPERPAIFEERYSAGVNTGHDAYSCNFSRDYLCENITRLKADAVINDDTVRVALYRPYVKEFLHFSRETIMRVYQLPQIFPRHDAENFVICITGLGSNKNFSVMMTDCLPGYDTMEKTQCFPLWWYDGVRRVDGVSDYALEEFRRRYSDEGITKEAIFYYVYGVLSSREYALRFGNDTKKLLARVPFARDFWNFERAGRKLGMLHVNYESVKGYHLVYDGVLDDLRVRKMRVLVDESGEKYIRYNDALNVRGIPAAAWNYIVNGRSALEWIVERYRDDVDKTSGLRNDCNAWGRSQGNAKYILELIGRVVRVSVESVRILGGMPELGV